MNERPNQKLPATSVSVVIPMLDEEPNLDCLLGRLLEVLGGMGTRAEIVLVDDGSTDGTLTLARHWHRRFPETVVVLSLARRAGQHAALLAGFGVTRGEVVVSLDADLQNPPEEIPALVAAMGTGHDLVTGRREVRRDAPWRRLLSAALRRLGPWLTGVPAHDYGCMLRAYRRDVVQDMLAIGSRSPFVPALAFQVAKNPIEVDVAHSTRLAGESKYGLLQLVRIQLDLMAGGSPRAFQHFGILGAGVLGIGVLVGGVGGAAMLMGRGAALAGAGLGCSALGLSWLGMGLLGEYAIRIHREVRGGVPLRVGGVWDARGDLAPPGPRDGDAGEAPEVVPAVGWGTAAESPRILVCAFRETGHAVLEFLLESGENVLAVATHPDEGDWPSVADLAERHQVPVLSSSNVRSPRFRATVERLGVDLILSVYYRRILPPEVLALAKVGAFNVHPSLLPAYRGRAPINWAILRGEAEVGVTIHEMIEAVDAGPIISQARLEVDADEGAGEVSERVGDLAVSLFRDTWPTLRNGDWRARARPQDESRAFEVGRRCPEDGRIDWNERASTVHNLVRAVTRPFPGAFSDVGGRRLFVWRSRPGAWAGPEMAPAGAIHVNGVGAWVRCGEGSALQLLEVSWEGPTLSGPVADVLFEVRDQVFGPPASRVGGAGEG